MDRNSDRAYDGGICDRGAPRGAALNGVEVEACREDSSIAQREKVASEKDVPYSQRREE